MVVYSLQMIFPALSPPKVQPLEHPYHTGLNSLLFKFRPNSVSQVVSSFCFDGREKGQGFVYPSLPLVGELPM